MKNIINLNKIAEDVSDKFEKHMNRAFVNGFIIPVIFWIIGFVFGFIVSKI